MAPGDPCVGEPGICNSRMECVACRFTSDCAPDADPCQRVDCIDGTCVARPVDFAHPCIGQSGACDATGSCVQCVVDGNCGGGECSRPTCVNGMCNVEPLAVGQTCRFTTSRSCDGAGSCVVCDGSCPLPGECELAVCAGQTCDVQPAPEGTPCGMAGTCDASGTCVACPVPCAPTSECDRAECVDGSCVHSFKYGLCTQPVNPPSSGLSYCDWLSGECVTNCVTDGQCFEIGCQRRICVDNQCVPGEDVPDGRPCGSQGHCYSGECGCGFEFQFCDPISCCGTTHSCYAPLIDTCP